MANISKTKREELLRKIESVKEYISSVGGDDKTEELVGYLNELRREVDGKKYGLVFEEHREKVDDLLSVNVPVFKEVKEYKIANSDGKYNFLLEGDNLLSLELLLKTHKKRIDVIYIDPPYNFKKFSNRNNVKFFVMDMTNNYKSLSFLFPNAKIITDRYHYVRQVYWALDNVRKRVQKAFIRDKRIYFKHSRRLLFADYHKLTDENKQTLIIMLSQSEQLHTAWRLKEDFKYFRNASTKQDAERELLSWISEAEESGLTEFRAATTAFHNWSRYIINSVVYKYSNGITEGFNNKIKVLKRNAYGYRNFENFRKRILLNCTKHGNQACA